MKKNRHVQKFIAFLLCLLMILSNTITSTNLSYAASSNKLKLKSMPLEAKLTNEKDKSKALKLKPQLSASKHKLGLVPAPFKLPKVKPTNILKNASYPTTYDLRTLGKVTPIRDQSTSGSCWAFATYSSLESNLLTEENRDFSENNLKNNSEFDFGQNDGGNQFMSTAYLARWSGPINEVDDPFNPNSITSLTKLPKQKHVQEVLWLQDRTGYLDNNTIKDNIMKHGVIYTSIYYEDCSYNSENNTYYVSWNYYGDNNHAVSIVGWDDNFEKNKFIDTYNGQVPAGDGAFIVKNSWGTSWGDKGYFYVSYYDENIGIENAVFNGAEETNNYKNIYQYDPLGFIDAIGYGTESSWFSNVFTASSNENLSAVSFNTVVPNTKYEIYVTSNYNNHNDLTSVRVPKGSGSISEAGYHTIKLSSVTLLAPGEKFAVIVKITTPGFGYQVPVERAISGYSGNATASAEQSFVSPSGYDWYDLTTAYDYTSNVCLKAFTQASTNPPSTVLVTFNSQGGSAVTSKTANYNSLITAPAAPTRTGYTFDGWHKEAGCINAWDFMTDKVTANTTLFAKWIESDESKAIGDFVTRLYQQCLNRETDLAGLNYWRNKLMTKICTGADISYSFILGPEFIARNVSDDVFINIMYKTFFDRASDSAGKAYWMEKLNSGISRLYVLSSFVNSTEFSNICTGYGIERGTIQLTKSTDLYPNLTAFVYRFYDRCLERKPDESGLDYHVNRLVKGQSSGSDLANSFVFSPEFTARNLSNNDFIKIMYRVFFNRDSDIEGMTYWVNKLNAGTTRLQAFNGFVSSKEFSVICSNYGIKVR